MDALRTVVHMDAGPTWDSRPDDSKEHVVVSEVARRLRGLSNLMYGIAVAEKQMGGVNTEQVSFIAAAVADLALALERADESWWNRVNAVPETKKPKRKKGGGS